MTYVMGEGGWMVEGRHRRRRRHHVALALGVTVAVLATAAGGVAYAGYRYDRARAARLLPGIHIAGVDVSDMTRAQAIEALQPAVRAILDRPIDVSVGSRTWTETAEQLGVSVDTSDALSRAFALSSSHSWTDRTLRRLLHHPLDASIRLRVSYDLAPVVAFVKRIAPSVARPARDASLDVVGGKVEAVSSRAGRALSTKRATTLLARAVAGGARSVTLPVRAVEPSVTSDSLGQTIVVRISTNQLFLYDGVKLERTYPVATGQPIYPTPTGHFQIITKEVDPTWVNPARDTWGKDEPAEIGPGPGNPLGTRAMALSAPGILIHGTYDDASIGHHASHGCIRMHIPDSEALFTMVGVGTPVIIVA
jgi:lipoprotein-anchoring transpeptidase ErfK/SrfK